MKRISWLGIFLIILGVILLASELGYLNIKWYDLLKFWPLIFVFWGIDILMGEKRWFIWVALLLLVFFLGVILFFMPYRMHKGIYRDWFLPYDPNIKSMDLSLKVGIRNFYLNPSPQDKKLIYLSSSTNFNIKERKEVLGDKMKLDLEIEEEPMFFSFGEDRNIFLSLPNDIDLSFTLNAGLGNSNLDFRGLKLSYLSIKGGVGNISAWLPKSTLKAEINGGVGNITIYIPEGTILDLQSEAGIGRVSVDSEIARFQGEITGKIIYLKIKSGIGNIVIKASKEII